MVVLTGSNLHSESWNVFHAIISGNITDPSARAKRWVLGDFPDIEGKDFPNYPIIVISNPEVASETITFDPGSALQKNTMSVTVTVFSKDPRTLNQLSDSVYSAVNDNHLTLIGSNIYIDTSSNGGRGTDVIGTTRVHFNEQIFNYMVTS